MTRFGINRVKKNQINFNSDVQFVSVLSNIDRRY